MIGKRDICMIMSGMVLGGGLVAAIGYFGVIKRYIPLRELESAIDEAREQYMEYKHKLSELHNEQEQDHDQESNDHIWQATIDPYRGINYSKVDAPNHDSTAGVPDHDTDRDDPLEYDEYDTEDVAEWDPFVNGYYDPLTFGEDRYIIDDDNPRWDGPLTDEEMERYRSVLGESVDIVDSVILTIKQHRYEQSIDEDRPIYQITIDEHDDMPPFFDTRTLDYYEDDDILALGRDIVPQIERYIDPICLNHFTSRGSGSGDPNIVWCRNDEHETDYEIVRQEDSYQHAVLGIPDPSDTSTSHFREREAVEVEETNGKHSRASS